MREKSLTLTWKASPEADLALYRLYWGIAKGYWLPLTSVSRDKTSLALRLPNTANYYFAVTAVDIAGNESHKTELKPRLSRCR